MALSANHTRSQPRCSIRSTILCGATQPAVDPRRAVPPRPARRAARVCTVSVDVQRAPRPRLISPGTGQDVEQRLAGRRRSGLRAC